MQNDDDWFRDFLAQVRRETNIQIEKITEYAEKFGKLSESTNTKIKKINKRIDKALPSKPVTLLKIFTPWAINIAILVILLLIYLGGGNISLKTDYFSFNLQKDTKKQGSVSQEKDKMNVEASETKPLDASKYIP